MRTEPGVTPLVELVALAASRGWEINPAPAGVRGELEWTREANRVLAKFAASSQRPQYCALLNTTANPTTGRSEVGAVVFRGVGNGGDSAEAIESLRRWFTQPVRQLTAPTQW